MVNPVADTKTLFLGLKKGQVIVISIKSIGGMEKYICAKINLNQMCSIYTRSFDVETMLVPGTKNTF